MGRKVFSVTLKKDRPDQRWGFGITGGKDVGLTIRIEKVSPSSPASAAGLHNLDYLVKVGNQEVFDMNHNEVVSMVRSAGSQLDIVVERAEDDVVVPSFDMLYPKQKEEINNSEYFQDAMKVGYPGGPGCFTSVGKPRVKVGANSSITLYSEDTIMEMAGGGGHGFVDESKLAPDCCPAARNRKRFDPTKSSALGAILAQDKGQFEPVVMDILEMQQDRVERGNSKSRTC